MSDSPALRPGGRREGKRDVLGWTIFGLVAIAVHVRLYFAIDFTDDSYYVALSR